MIRRVVATLLLGWFAIVTGEPAALHSCPMHDATAAHHASPADHPAHHHIDGSGAATTGRHGSHANSSAPSREEHPGCTCIGRCSSATFTWSVPAQRIVLAITGERRVRELVPSAALAAITAPAFLLPYANGPPGAVLA